MLPVPYIPPLFISLSERFGLLLAGGFAIMMFVPLEKMGPNSKRGWPATALLVLLFSMFTILGTYSGNIVFQSFANLRATGAITAGLFGGPVVGLLTGLIAASHRYLIDVGGFSSLPCALATLIEGAAAGVFAWWAPSRRLDWRVGFLIAVVGETLHMVLVLVLSSPLDKAIQLVEVIGLPMILINSIGVAIFVQILNMQLYFKDLRDSANARQVLSIVKQTLGHLREGLTLESARATAEIILKETDVAAVALTSRELVLAHVGLGQDHHLAGRHVSTRATQAVLETGEPKFLRDRESIGCENPGCPLTGAIIIPLFKGTELLGCLKLYGARKKPLDQTRFELAKGLADLLSTQLELEDIGIKERLLANAEIRRLQAQINPHFLFNSLNTVASFCRTAPAQARELILDLAKYLRRNLDSREVIPLADELEQIRSYLAIEQARFGERISASIMVEKGLEACPIPPLLIQPLVENSVRHGILNRPEGGAVRVEAVRDDDCLRVTVEDNGVGIDDRVRQDILGPIPVNRGMGGIGARNCNQRLVQMYGPGYALDIDSLPRQGTRISFRIPIPAVG